MSRLWLVPVVFGLTVIGTAWVRQYALRRLVDVPGDRSSHDVPMPRGGGAAIVGVVTAVWILGLVVGAAPVALVPLVAGSLVVAGLGFADDHWHLSAAWRLVGHVVAGAAVALVIADGNWLAAAVISFTVVWMINLTNFMDGIDGIAAIQTISVFGGGAIVTWAAGGNPDVVWAAIIVMTAAAGFLCWNWPPAKIFMGDVGSGYLGFLMGAMTWWAGQSGLELLGAWTILHATFMTDATVTLLRRLARGEALFEAHRSHAYQLLATERSHHRRVSLLFGAINVAWLLPVALLVATGRTPVVPGVALAYAPLVGAAVWVQIRRYTFPT